MVDIYSLLFFVGTLSAMGVLISYLINRNKLADDLRGAVPYFWLTGVSAVYEQVFTFFLRVDATVYFRIYGFLDPMLILYFYSRVLRGERAALWFAAALHVVVCAYLAINFDQYDLQQADQVMVPLATVFVFYFTFGWFRQKFMEMEDTSLLSMGSFYMISGIFIYSAATIFLFLYSSLVRKAEGVNFLLDFWVFNIFMGALARVIFIVAIWKGRKT